MKEKKTIKECLSNLTPEQKAKFGKELAMTLRANRRAQELERELGMKMGNNLLTDMEKNDDVEGLYSLTDAMGELFLCRFVWESICRVGEAREKKAKKKGKK